MPECALGYSEAQLREQFGGSMYAAFEEYMLMKADPMCAGSADPVPSVGAERSCGTAEGHFFYVRDVLRFVEQRPEAP